MDSNVVRFPIVPRRQSPVAAILPDVGGYEADKRDLLRRIVDLAYNGLCEPGTEDLALKYLRELLTKEGDSN